VPTISGTWDKGQRFQHLDGNIYTITEKGAFARKVMYMLTTDSGAVLMVGHDRLKEYVQNNIYVPINNSAAVN